MEIKELSKIIDLCTKKGVETIEIEGIKLSFREFLPKKESKRPSPSTSEMVADESSVAAEDILFWSSAGIPPEVTNG